MRLAIGLAGRGWPVSVLTAAGGPTVLPCDAELGRTIGLEVLEAPYRDRLAAFRRILRIAPPDNGVTGQSPVPPGGQPNRCGLWLAFRELLLFPDEHVGWIAGAVATGRLRLQRGDIGVILSTSPPESGHIVAARLSREAGLPWVADFRDPWSFSHQRPRGVTDILHRLVESRTIAGASALVTVSPTWSGRFRGLYPRIRQETIPNGFATRYNQPSSARESAAFTLLYTGKIDYVHNPLDLLLGGFAAALRTARWRKGQVRLVFHCYGTSEAPFRSLVTRLELHDHVSWAGAVDQQTALELQGRADVLVLLGWDSDVGVIPAKLFDYLGAERRILHVGRADSDAAGVLGDCARGETAASADACRDILRRWYEEWSPTHHLPAGGNAEAIQAHSFSQRLDAYERLLGDLTSRRLPN